MAYLDGSNERAWLCKIATNKSLDYLKRAGRKSVPTEDVYFSAIAAPESVEEKYLEKEVRQKLYDCCLALKPPYREVALDYYYHEMEIGEIVKKTGKNIKTLQTQIYRAKGMLKKLYGKEEPAYGKTATLIRNILRRDSVRKSTAIWQPVRSAVNNLQIILRIRN